MKFFLNENELVEKKTKKHHKHADSVTYTTGDIGYNIAQFNKHMGTDNLPKFVKDNWKKNYPGNDNNNPSTEEAKASKAAEDAADAVNSNIGVTSLGSGGEGGALGGDSGSSGAVGESFELKETKRYVTRYYVRPQNVYASNKKELLKILVDAEGENCSVYSLKNLQDNDDVHKLTNKDIIYYYDWGVLYDKNHVRVMDYDISPRHEEKRKKFPGEPNLNSPEGRQAYEDRITKVTDFEEAFNLDFTAVNAFGETLNEAMDETVCCICGEPFEGHGNNPAPVKDEGRCCDNCNLKFVVPARLQTMDVDGE